MPLTSFRIIGAVASAVVVLTACGSQSTGSGASPPPPASSTPSATASAAASPVLQAQAVAGNGTILVAASDGMTVYTFDSDSPGVSRCNGACANTWPPLTVPAGVTPTGGAGVTGQLGTINRSDGTVQVTYKGLPLYFFHNDQKPGDTKGNYTGWKLVHP